jgi:hypothetical protein
LHASKQRPIAAPFAEHITKDRRGAIE